MDYHFVGLVCPANRNPSQGGGSATTLGASLSRQTGQQGGGTLTAGARAASLRGGYDPTCHGAPYETVVGAAKEIAPRAAKRIAPGAAKRIASGRPNGSSGGSQADRLI